MLVAVGIEEVLAASRLGVERLTPEQSLAAAGCGALLIDTRTAAQRCQQGELPGALVIDRTVLEWRLDPASPARIPEAASYDIEIVVVCREGYSSSLAAASLRAIGLHRATDVVGGVVAWRAAGLPMDTGPADVRRRVIRPHQFLGTRPPKSTWVSISCPYHSHCTRFVLTAPEASGALRVRRAHCAGCRRGGSGI